MADLQSKVKSIKDQVALAVKAVNDAKFAAAAGIDPTKVLEAAAKVFKSAASQLHVLHFEKHRRSQTVMDIYNRNRSR